MGTGEKVREEDGEERRQKELRNRKG